ncbi:hypothetical protein EDB19DRAFT_1693874 [Suillus lakei]|nr:hypothetical protein EDB19DRAFT_1693874 [Suillus lakei]
MILSVSSLYLALATQSTTTLYLPKESLSLYTLAVTATVIDGSSVGTGRHGPVNMDFPVLHRPFMIGPVYNVRTCAVQNTGRLSTRVGNISSQ